MGPDLLALTQRDRDPLLRAESVNTRRRGVERHDPPGIDDHDAVAQLPGLLHVVRRQEDRLSLGSHVADQVPGRVASLRIEPAGQLVQEDQLRIADQRQRDREALLLATGEIGVGDVLPVGQAEPLEDRLRLERPRVEGGEQAHGLAHPQPRREAASWSCAPIRCLSASPSRRGSSPRTCTRSPSGARSPSRHSIVVVFPAPFGPTTPKISPAATWNEMASTARTAP